MIKIGSGEEFNDQEDVSDPKQEMSQEQEFGNFQKC